MQDNYIIPKATKPPKVKKIRKSNELKVPMLNVKSMKPMREKAIGKSYKLK